MNYLPLPGKKNSNAKICTSKELHEYNYLFQMKNDPRIAPVTFFKRYIEARKWKKYNAK